VLLWSPFAHDAVLRVRDDTLEADTHFMGSYRVGVPANAMPWHRFIEWSGTLPLPPAFLPRLRWKGSSHVPAGESWVHVGAVIDAEDRSGFWYPAVITAVRYPAEAVSSEHQECSSIRVHYDGWDPAFDEDIDLGPMRDCAGAEGCDHARHVCAELRIAGLGTMTGTLEPGSLKPRIRRDYGQKKDNIPHTWYLPDAAVGEPGRNASTLFDYKATDGSVCAADWHALLGGEKVLTTTCSNMMVYLSSVCIWNSQALEEGVILPLLSLRDPHARPGEPVGCVCVLARASEHGLSLWTCNTSAEVDGQGFMLISGRRAVDVLGELLNPLGYTASVNAEGGLGPPVQLREPHSCEGNPLDLHVGKLGLVASSTETEPEVFLAPEPISTATKAVATLRAWAASRPDFTIAGRGWVARRPVRLMRTESGKRQWRSPAGIHYDIPRQKVLRMWYQSTQQEHRMLKEMCIEELDCGTARLDVLETELPSPDSYRVPSEARAVPSNISLPRSFSTQVISFDARVAMTIPLPHIFAMSSLLSVTSSSIHQRWHQRIWPLEQRRWSVEPKMCVPSTTAIPAHEIAIPLEVPLYHVANRCAPTLGIDFIEGDDLTVARAPVSSYLCQNCGADSAMYEASYTDEALAALVRGSMDPAVDAAPEGSDTEDAAVAKSTVYEALGSQMQRLFSPPRYVSTS
jgi:hypothetical protein